jgi:hypothetical protein
VCAESSRFSLRKPNESSMHPHSAVHAGTGAWQAAKPRPPDAKGDFGALAPPCNKMTLALRRCLPVGAAPAMHHGCCWTISAPLVSFCGSIAAVARQLHAGSCALPMEARDGWRGEGARRRWRGGGRRRGWRECMSVRVLGLQTRRARPCMRRRAR